MTSPTMQTYTYDNDNADAMAHHRALAMLLDPLTRSRITELVDLAGARCLEVAAGAGSVATWLADQVGSGGSVTATDTKPGLIPPHPRLTVLAHDITAATAPGRNYQLVHARLLLNHLPQRRQSLQRMADALAPAGVLLTEDFFPTPPRDFVVCAPAEEDAALIRRCHLAHQQILAEHGNDRDWSKRATIAFMEEGLVDVCTVAHGATWRGGDAGCQLLLAVLRQVSDELIGCGLTPAELHRVRQLLADPSVMLHGYLLYSTSGRRPSG